MAGSDWGLRNEERFLAASRRIVLKKWAVEALGGKCSLCPYNRSFRAFEFHHRDPTKKDFNISSGLSMSAGVLWTELQKCLLVCANCHREIHDGLYPHIYRPGEGIHDDPMDFEEESD